jgi:hypothetical protein
MALHEAIHKTLKDLQAGGDAAGLRVVYAAIQRLLQQGTCGTLELLVVCAETALQVGGVHKPSYVECLSLGPQSLYVRGINCSCYS